ncbi:recombinase family protein [Actinomadura litoris]|uniref:recombinase family protein n=1 Tax=Actinomadura litoris TaxID=2678616 RepID=UPI001FA6CD47|nr:recombinase family protein [Actinomadura litoris]
MLAGELKAGDVGLEFLTGELKGSHDPSGMEREYIRDRTLEGHESARKRGKTIGGAGGTDDDMLSMALHPRDQEMSLRDIAKRLVITTGVKGGPGPRACHRHADAARARRTGHRSGEQVIFGWFAAGV